MKPTPGNIRTLAEAHAVEGKLKLLTPTYGIYLNPTGGNQYIPENAFDGITEGNFLICTGQPGESTPEQFIPNPGDFMSVDMVLDLIARAPNAAEAISQLMAILKPGTQQGQVNSKLMSMPGVQEAWNKAIAEAWDKVAPTPFR